ncbi:MAG: VCBS repeat-containing protein, partial [Myxococcota bacterium]
PSSQASTPCCTKPSPQRAGFVQQGVEACDDGNPDDTDDCLDTCAAAACGDGVVRSGVEDCDDGSDNGVEGSTCFADCRLVDVAFGVTDQPIDPMRREIEHPTSLTVGDFDGDGVPDLVVGAESYEDGVLTRAPLLRMMNDGTGTFWGPRADDDRLSTGGNITLGDLEQDGLVDLLLPGRSADFPDTLVRYQGDPDGLDRGVLVETDAGSTVGGSVDYGPRHVVVVDLLGSGRLDAVTANASDTASLSVLLNNGLGGLTDVAHLQLPDDGWADEVVVVDITGDGVVDLVAPDISNDRLVVYVGIANSVQFEAPRLLDLPAGPTTLAPFDLDQDGTFELLVWVSQQGAHLVRWDGAQLVDDGVLPEAPCDSAFEPPAAGDADGDGLDDLLVACSDGALGVLVHTATPGQPLYHPLECDDCAGGQVADISLDDADRDGRLDALVAWTSTEVGIFWNDGTRPSGPPSRWFVDALERGFAYLAGIGAADVTGDGMPDLVCSGLFGPFVVPGVGPRRFLPAGGLLVSQPRRGIGVGNFDDDGPQDLFLAYTNFQPEFPVQSSGILTWSFSTTARPIIQSRIVDLDPDSSIEPGHDLTNAAVGDLDGDGITDAIWTSDFDDLYVVHMGQGDRTLGFSTFLDAPSPGTRDVVLADGDGDGTLDLFGVDPVARLLDVRAGDGAGDFGLPDFPETGPEGTEPVELVVADLTDDGLSELIVIHRGDDSLSVAVATAPLTWDAPVIRPLDQAPIAVDVGDVSSDGLVDVVVVGADGVDVFLGLGDGALAAPLRFAVGDDPRDVAVFDADGDGADDVITANRGSHDLTVLLTGG